MKVFTLGTDGWEHVGQMLQSARRAGARRIVDIRPAAPGQWGRGAMFEQCGKAGMAYWHLPGLTPADLGPCGQHEPLVLLAYKETVHANDAFKKLVAAAHVPSALLCTAAAPVECHRFIVAGALAKALGGTSEVEHLYAQPV